jgi:imidazolonepropionase-like amidohydrolase
VSGPILLATTIALRGATLIDGTGAPALPDSLLIVADGRIVAVGRATPAALEALPSGVPVVDVRGTWILPGLIDAHVHMETEEDLRTMLARGVTSVRLMAEDTESAVRLARESDARDDIPQVFPAAPIFTTKGGWWDQGQPPDAHLDRFPATAAAARESVRRAKALGTREIKIMLDDMSWCRAPKPPLPKLPLPVMEALVAEGRAQGLRVIVHAPNLADAKAAIAAGATALAHGVLDPFDDDTLATMKARPVFYVPTMDILSFSPLRAPSSMESSPPPARQVGCRPRSSRSTGRGSIRTATPSATRTSRACGDGFPPCARTSGSCARSEFRSRSEPTCGRFRGSPFPSRWASTSPRA